MHAVLTSKGQATIPLKVRARLNLKPGDRLAVDVEGDRIIMRLDPSVKAVYGVLKGKGRARRASTVRSSAERAWASESLGRTRGAKAS
jgi:AbrB family looped-hinge helix DNA binding protein